MPSLRRRLLAGTITTCTAVFIVLGFALDTVERRTLLARFDDVLRSRAMAVASMVEWDGRSVHFDFNPANMPEFSAGEQPQYFQVWTAGKPFARSGSLAGGELAPVPTVSGIQWTTLPDGRHGRLLTLTFTPITEPRERARVRTPPPPAALAMGRDSADLDRSLERLRWTTLLTSAAGLGVLMAVLVLVVHRATRSVGRLSRAIASVDAAQPGVALAVAGLPAELAPVVDRLNELLARLAEALDRERAFTADVAHELRTPLAGIRTTLEVCRTRPREPQAYEQAIDRSMAMIGQMQALVHNMLMLARADAGHLVAGDVVVDVEEALRDGWRAAEHTAHARRLELRWETAGRAVARADPQLVPVLLGNLLQNAVHHAPAETAITIRLAGSAHHCCVSIENAAPALAPGDVAHLFDRFWRKDAARSQTSLHSGLGLSLCRRLATLMRGSISAELSAGILRFTLLLPAAGADSPPLAA
jgi:signal transduction histidine kinase